jgi:hypothetical protein
MADAIQDKLSRWSLERVKFLLAHIEGFIENDDDKNLIQRAREFTPATDLTTVQSLVEANPSDPRLPTLVLEALAPFFESGLLLQRSPAADSSHWWATDLFWRGNTFHLELADQVRANHLVPEMTPLQVHRSPAAKMLDALKLQFLAQKNDADAYLLRPTPTVAYVLMSNLGAPWSPDHLTQAQRLINKCFIY